MIATTRACAALRPSFRSSHVNRCRNRLTVSTVPPDLVATSTSVRSGGASATAARTASGWVLSRTRRLR